MKPVRRLIAHAYRLASILSLDVAAGAVCGCGLFARHLGVAVRWPHLAVLGGCVWLVYTADHLLDAALHRVLLTPRHRFHRRHRTGLLAAWAVAAAATGWLAVAALPPRVFDFGLLLGCLLAAYLVLAHSGPLPYFQKEAWVAVLYTAGVWGNVAVAAPVVQPVHWLAGGVFGLLVWQQALLLAWYEADDDHQQRMASAARPGGTARLYTRLVLLQAQGLGLCLLGLAFFAETPAGRPVWGTLLAISIGLAVLTWFPGRFRQGGRYRLLADALLLLPAWVLVVTG